MTKLRLLLLFPLLSALVVGLTTTSFAAKFDPQTMMDVREVQRGARAIGRTVFAGTEISEFRLEIIDIMSRANLGSDMILARVLDGPVVARQSGIIGGMSGSPVYINGRLIGAVAWGWGFQKEPIAGITPIRSMLEAFDLMDGATALKASTQQWIASQPLTLGGKRFTSAKVLLPGQKPTSGVIPLYPVSTPINCNGMGPRTLELAKREFARFGLEPMAGGGGTAKPVPVELVPGAAIGVRFMEGDFDMTGIGTVTYREGDRVLGFGHPMMQLGNVNLPMTTAWINDFMPSYEHSNKMGSGMVTVGSLRADMPWAVGGQLGSAAPLIPARIEIVDRTRKTQRTYNIKVARQMSLTPAILTMGISSALEASYNPGLEGTIRTRFEVQGDKGARCVRENQFHMAGAPAQVALGEVSEIMNLLEENRWQPQEVSELTFRAEIEQKDLTAVIERVYLEENIAKAGKPLRVHVLLRPDSGDLQEEVFTLNMPLDLPKGSLKIGIGGGQDSMYFRGRLGLMVPDFDSLSSLLSYYQGLEQNKQLCVMVAMPNDGVGYGTTRLMRLPASISAVLEKSSRTDLTRGKEEMLANRDLPYIVFGREMLTVATEDKQGKKGTTTAPATAPTVKPPTETPSKTASDQFAQKPAATGLWWAASAFNPVAAARLRAEAAAQGNPWPVAASKEAPKASAAAASAPDRRKDSAAGTDGDKPAKDADEEKDDSDKAAKTIVRQALTWKQQTRADFATGDVKGTATTSDGTVVAAPAMTSVGEVGEFQIWGLVATDKGVFASTSGPGRVYRVSGKKPELLFDCDSFGVRALTADSAGNLYAGTWPGGTIYKITPDGKGEVFSKLPCDYVWALAFDASGNLLAGTGPSGELFQVDSASNAVELIQLPQAHVLSVLPTKDAVYLGTAGKGLTYKLLPDRRLLALLDTDTDDVTSLVLDAEGSVCAGTSGGKVYRLPADKPSELLLSEKSQPVYALALAGGKLYAATGTDGKILSLESEDSYATVEDTERTHVLCLTTAPDRTLYAGTGNMAEVLRFDPNGATEGSFTSSVFDAKRASRWMTLQWQGEAPKDTELTLETRSGNSANPDDGSWSGWASPTGQPGNQEVNSPEARYLQYRVQMKTAAGADSPKLRRVAISYLPANQRPKVDFDDLDEWQALRAKAEIEWSATDDDGDQMTVKLEYRRAATTEWKQIAEIAAKEGSHKWDTSGVPDGFYDLRITASDEISNPGMGLQSEKIAYGIALDNAKPELAIQKTQVVDGRLVIEGLATDNNRVAEVAYQTDELWQGAIPVDGTYDGQFEQFRLTVPLKDNEVEVEIRVQDAAGNLCTETVMWPLESAKDAPKQENKPRR